MIGQTRISQLLARSLRTTRPRRVRVAALVVVMGALMTGWLSPAGVASSSDVVAGVDVLDAVEVAPPAGATPVIDGSGNVAYAMPEGIEGMRLTMSPTGEPSTSWLDAEADSPAVASAAAGSCDLYSRAPYRSGETIGFPVTLICRGPVTFMFAIARGQIRLNGKYYFFGAPGFGLKERPGTVFATGLAGCNDIDRYRTYADGIVAFGDTVLSHPPILSDSRAIYCGNNPSGDSQPGDGF